MGQKDNPTAVPLFETFATPSYSFAEMRRLTWTNIPESAGLSILHVVPRFGLRWNLRLFKVRKPLLRPLNGYPSRSYFFLPG